MNSTERKALVDIFEPSNAKTVSSAQKKNPIDLKKDPKKEIQKDASKDLQKDAKKICQEMCEQRNN